jgi:hypothetical protein
MSEQQRPKNVTDEHLDYLDDLRESGATNMFGAGSYVVDEFGVDKIEARGIVRYWMDSFGSPSR